MATNEELISIGVDADLGPLKAELDKVPAEARKATKGAARAMAKDFKRIERSAGSTAKQVKQDWSKTKGAFDSSRKALSAFGGTAGSVAQMGGDLIESFVSMGGALGPVAAAAGAATVGVGALAAGMLYADKLAIDFARSVVDANKRLEEMGLASHDVSDLSDAVTALDVGMDQLTVAFGAATPELTKFLDRLVGLAVKAGDAADGVSSAVGWVNDLALSSMAWADSKSLVGEFRDSVFETGETLEETGKKQREAIKKALELQKMEKEAQEDILAGQREQAKADREAAKARAAYAREAAKEAAEVKAKWEEAGRIAARNREEEEANVAAIHERRAANEAAFTDLISSLQAVRSETQAVRDEQAEMNAAYLFMAEEMARQVDTIAAPLLDIFTDLADQRMEALASEGAQLKRTTAKELERLDAERENIKAKLEAGKISEVEGKQELARIDAQIKAKKDARRREKKDLREAIMDAHKASKAAAIARATIDAAANAIALTGAMAYLGPGAPAAALAISAAQLGLQIATIKKTKPPKFAGGGMVRERIEGDHAPIMADPNEGIVTPQGVQALGGPAGLAAVNQGNAPQGGGSTKVYLDSRLLGEVVARIVESDQRVTAALERRVGAIPGIRR